MSIRLSWVVVVTLVGCLESRQGQRNGMAQVNDSAVHGDGDGTSEDASADVGFDAGNDTGAADSGTIADTIVDTVADPDTATDLDTAGPGDVAPDSAADTTTISLCPGVIDCAQLDTQCLVGVCVPETGLCEAVPRAEPLACDDDDPCTLNDACDAGRCGGDEVWVLLDGTSVPTAQGWLETTNLTTPVNVSADGDAVELNTLPPVTISTGAMVLYSHAVPEATFDTHALELTMHVIAANPHNPLDAGVALLAAYTPAPVNGFGTGTQRAQMVFFDEGHVGWADETDEVIFDTTDGFHVYRLDINVGGTGLSIDGVTVLTRPALQLNGTIAFGDQTNDGPSAIGPSPNGHMRISSIRMVPKPALNCMP